MSKGKRRNGTKDITVQDPILSLTGVNSGQYSNIKVHALNSNNLAGMEDIALIDTPGVPFLLVDGALIRTRQQLHISLLKREKSTMKRIQNETSLLPLLEYTTPPTGWEPITASEEDEQEELDFQTDLQMLCLADVTLDTSDREQTTETIAPVTPTIRENQSRLQEICTKLDNLRHQQEDDINLRIPETIPEPPRVKRQGTFDIDRKDSIVSLQPSATIPSIPPVCPINSKENLIRAVTVSQLDVRSTRQFPSLPKTSTTTCLYENEGFSLVSKPKQKKNLKPGDDQRPKIINQIGNLLMQLPHDKEEKRVKDASYSYLVTISPDVAASNCKIEPIATPRSNTKELTPNTQPIRKNRDAKQSSPPTTSSTSNRVSRNNLGNGNVRRPISYNPPSLVGSKLAISSETPKNSPLNRKTQTFRNMPSPFK